LERRPVVGGVVHGFICHRASAGVKQPYFVKALAGLGAIR